MKGRPHVPVADTTARAAQVPCVVCTSSGPAGSIRTAVAWPLHRLGLTSRLMRSQPESARTPEHALRAWQWPLLIVVFAGFLPGFERAAFVAELAHVIVLQFELKSVSSPLLLSRGRPVSCA